MSVARVEEENTAIRCKCHVLFLQKIFGPDSDAVLSHQVRIFIIIRDY